MSSVTLSASVIIPDFRNARLAAAAWRCRLINSAVYDKEQEYGHTKGRQRPEGYIEIALRPRVEAAIAKADRDLKKIHKTTPENVQRLISRRVVVWLDEELSSIR